MKKLCLLALSAAAALAFPLNLHCQNTSESNGFTHSEHHAPSTGSAQTNTLIEQTDFATNETFSTNESDSGVQPMNPGLENPLSDDEKKAPVQLDGRAAPRHPPDEYAPPQDTQLSQTFIPVRKPLQRYEPLWMRSPFVIATPAENSPVQQNSQYSLASIIKVGEEYFAHVIETATQRRLPVSKNPSPEHGLLLIDVREDPIPSRTTATISVRGAPVTISFDSGSFAPPGGSPMAGLQNMNPYMPNPQGIPGMQTQTFPGQPINQQQIMQQQMIQQQLMQQQIMQQQSQQIPQPGTMMGVPPTQGGITPPEVTTTRRIIRRRAAPDGAAPMDIPPNTIINPPPQ